MTRSDLATSRAPYPRRILLHTDTARTARFLDVELSIWCTRHDPRLRSHTSFTGCGCGCGAPRRFWSLDADMLDEYGPLPFTARGRRIRWRWWHYLVGRPAFTVTGADLLVP